MRGILYDRQNSIKVRRKEMNLEEQAPKAIQRFYDKGYSVILDTPFIGDTFTISTVIITKVMEDRSVLISRGEGIARRSILDKQDLSRGIQISSGRALKAAWLKIHGKRDVHCHSLLMG
jgi:hypothetical protein